MDFQLKKNNFNNYLLTFNSNNSYINIRPDISPNFKKLPQHIIFMHKPNIINNHSPNFHNNNKSFTNIKKLVYNNKCIALDETINNKSKIYNNNQNNINIINNNYINNNFNDNSFKQEVKFKNNLNIVHNIFNNNKNPMKNEIVLKTAQNNPKTMDQYNIIFGNLKPEKIEKIKGTAKKEIEESLFKRNNNYNKNIIYYDEALKKTAENNFNCAFFKLKLKGTFYGVNNYELFKYICYLIKHKRKQFILICSGSSAKKCFAYCTQINQIYEYYIYCNYIEKYIFLFQTYPKLKGVFNDFNKLINELFNNKNNSLNKLSTGTSNLIFFEEYNDLFIKFHLEIIRKYSLYKLLKSNNSNKSIFLDLIKKKMPYYSDLARQLLYQDDEAMISFFLKNTNESKETLKKVFNSNHTIKNYLSNYTIEGFYYKYINKFLRQGDFNSYRLLSNHLSKFIYHLYEYRKKLNQERTATLYRKMYITKEELKVYIKSLGKVICYPSFTSTSILQDVYEPKNPNNGSILVKLVIEQNNSKSIISIKELSKYPEEEEYLCLPFSFFKITLIMHNLNKIPYTIYLTALNSEKPLEEMLLEFMEKETDNLDLEGLDMIVLTNDGTNMILNKYFTYNFYSTHKFGNN